MGIIGEVLDAASNQKGFPQRTVMLAPKILFAGGTRVCKGPPRRLVQQHKHVHPHTEPLAMPSNHVVKNQTKTL